MKTALCPLSYAVTQFVDARQDYAQAADAKLLPAVRRYLASGGPVSVKTPLITFDWVTIPAGEYTVSKDALGGDAGKKVNLSEYRIAKKLVTNAQYKTFVDATGKTAPA